MSRIPILIDETTLKVLVILARHEYRDPRQQAAVIIRDELVRRGLLVAEPQTPLSIAPAEQFKQRQGGNGELVPATGKVR